MGTGGGNNKEGKKRDLTLRKRKIEVNIWGMQIKSSMAQNQSGDVVVTSDYVVKSKYRYLKI